MQAGAGSSRCFIEDWVPFICFSLLLVFSNLAMVCLHRLSLVFMVSLVCDSISGIPARLQTHYVTHLELTILLPLPPEP